MKAGDIKNNIAKISYTFILLLSKRLKKKVYQPRPVYLKVIQILFFGLLILKFQLTDHPHQ